MSFAVRATRDFRWLVERTESNLTANARGIECVEERSERIVGMLAYDQWTRNACTAHVAVETSVAWRRLLSPAFEYPFLEANKGIVVAAVSSANKKSLRLMDKLGFRLAYKSRDYIAPGEDMLFFEMRREECRWLRR